MTAVSTRARRASRRLALKRQYLEQAVEQAIAALDALDGDPDYEDGLDREADADFESDVLDPDEIVGLAEARVEYGMGGAL